tara:strand:- start:4901 stop:5008 length:108 start_codon:yes stop_codon:yes gene_type:complete
MKDKKEKSVSKKEVAKKVKKESPKTTRGVYTKRGR